MFGPRVSLRVSCEVYTCKYPGNHSTEVRTPMLLASLSTPKTCPLYHLVKSRVEMATP
jgi:hypothetical protein